MSVKVFDVTAADEGVVTFRIATDDEFHLSPAWSRRFIAALESLGRDASVRAIVLTGGERVFCAGASRDALLARDRSAPPTSYAQEVSRALMAVPVPVVAAMAGHAVGGGLVMGLLCDTAVLGRESLYGANFMALGFTPGMGATVVVEEAFGPVVGRRLLYTGELMTGQAIREAHCPLSHAVRPRADVPGVAQAIARDIAEAPRAALVLLKRSSARRRMASLEPALTAELADQARLFADPAAREEIARRYVRSQAEVDD